MDGSIFKNPGSKYYHAKFKVWHLDSGKWKWVTRSTRTTDEDTAMIIMKEFASTSLQASKFPTGTSLTKSYVEGVVISILGAAGIDVADFKPSDKGIIEYCDIYMEGVLLKKPKSHKTYTSHYNTFKVWLKEKEAMKMDLNWLNVAKCNEFYEWAFARLTAKSAGEKINFVKRVLDKAVNEEFLLVNPTSKVVKSEDDDQLGREPFPVDEAFQLIDWLMDNEPDWARAAMIGFMAGVRINDAGQMKSKALKDGVLTYKQHKTRKVLHVPLVVERYAEFLIVDREYICGDLAERFVKGKAQWLSSEFVKHIKSAGINIDRYEFEKTGRRVAKKSFHSLRHTLRSLIVGTGGSDAQADQILGHSQGQGRRYTHSELMNLKEVLEQALDD